MDIISYENFYNLKLADFIENKEEIETLYDWEFMNAIWHGESIGFSEWLQLSDEPKEKSISLDLCGLSEVSINKISSALKLNIVNGLTKEDIVTTFGFPKNTESYANDRVTLEYIIGSTEKYYVSFTITNEKGLIYLVVMNHSQTIINLEKKTTLNYIIESQKPHM